MGNAIVLSCEIGSDCQHVFEVLTTTDGQRSFWTSDCEVASDSARFSFVGSPFDLDVTVRAEPIHLVQMRVVSGFPNWAGSTWAWELEPVEESRQSTRVLFRHSGFAEGYLETDVAGTAQTWALILDRLKNYAESGVAQPFFT